jgi:hypothetical protein
MAKDPIKDSIRRAARNKHPFFILFLLGSIGQTKPASLSTVYKIILLEND